MSASQDIGRETGLNGLNWPVGGGEVGRRLREPGFVAAGLGAVEAWPIPLRTVLQMALASHQPLFAAWGPELAFLHNDAYAGLFPELHPKALGRPLHRVWAGVWEHFAPIVKRTLNGEGSLFREQRFRLLREGRREDAWFNISFTPLHDEAGAVGGLICSTTEVTDRVRADRRRRACDGEPLGAPLETPTEIRLRSRAEAELSRLNETLEARVAAEIAERRQAEAALLHAQKLETIGKLTGGVAHDFNNLLQVISGNLQLLAKDVTGNACAERRVANALAGVTRGAKLTGQLLAFGRRQPLQPRPADVGRLVTGMEDMLHRALGDGVEVKLSLSPGLWPAFVDPSHLENALLNLAINGRDAMNDHGQLTIACADAYLDAAYARSRHDVAAGQYVMVEVADTGSGMTPEVLTQAFEPFFTTKPPGKGTGLGLSMVYGFVKQSGGHVRIHSELGAGTAIRLYLPRTNQPVEPAEPPRAGEHLADQIAACTGRVILVVDDETEVRDTAVELLIELGYRVLKAKDATAAAAILDSGAPIDLLFTDVVMPGPLDSRELARRAQARLPHIAVLFTTGYAEDVMAEPSSREAQVAPDIRLLPKPYSRDALAEAVRSALNARRRRRGPSHPQAPHPTEPPQETAVPACALSVLVVDGDPAVRANLAELVRTLGHAAVEAADAPSAFATLGTDPIDVLLAAEEPPGMGAPCLVERAREIQPALGVVLAQDGGAEPAVASLEAAVLAKPYDSAALSLALTAVHPGLSALGAVGPPLQ
jgi:signal transduction histidine kinase/CheY-like chemotaxis protein